MALITRLGFLQEFIMKSVFRSILRFFSEKQNWTPGDYKYDAEFCQMLIKASSARDASVWRLDGEHVLHMVYGTGIPPEKLSKFSLLEGEGISGAAILSRRPVTVADALSNPQHSQEVDRFLGTQTHAMISAPIMFRDFVYGAVNVINPISDKPFSPEYQDYVQMAATLYAAALDAAGRLTLFNATHRKNRSTAKNSLEQKKTKTIIVGHSLTVREALDLCLKAGRIDMPVLIRGETGSGKELAARRIHESSHRSDGPFLEMNCAALPDSLLESELFGHVKGAFSGAESTRQGKFLTASGGTLFLDEIGDMSLVNQAKILRVLQEKKITPVGSDKPKQTDVRVIAATKYDLQQLVKKGRFREDLYYRLCGVEIVMPPLRERLEDIEILITYFMNRIHNEQRQINPSIKRLKISQEAVHLMQSYNWPGNVRQLEQAIGAANAICDGDEIQPRDLPKWLQIGIIDHNSMKSNIQGCNFREKSTRINEKRGYLDIDHQQYLKTLEETKYLKTNRYNFAAAAAKLKIPRKTLTYRLKKLGII